MEKDPTYIIINDWIPMLENPFISWKAKGIMMAFVKDPTLTVGKLLTMTAGGEFSLRSGIKELIWAGFLVQTTARDDKGKYVGTHNILNPKQL